MELMKKPMQFRIEKMKLKNKIKDMKKQRKIEELI